MVTYTITGDGKVEAALKWKGKAVESVPEFGLMLTLPAEYRNVAYYGMGPGETYSDFTSGAHMGLFGFDAHTALQPYFNPQESGARTGVQAAAVTDAAGFGLCLAGNGFMLSALPYTPHEVENARRQYELPPKVKTVVRCAKGQLGVAGDNTWGARTPCRIPCGAGEGRNLPLHFWRHGRQWMSRPVAGKNKKGEGRPRAAVKRPMKKPSSRTMTYLCLALLLVLAGFFIW